MKNNVELFAYYITVKIDVIIQALVEKRFDAMYATYFLLCDKLKRHVQDNEIYHELAAPRPPLPSEQPRRGSGSITKGIGTVTCCS